MKEVYFNILSAMNLVQNYTCIKFREKDLVDQHIVLFTLGKERYINLFVKTIKYVVTHTNSHT